MKILPAVVLWSRSGGEGLYSEVLRRVHGSDRLEIWLIPRWGPFHGGDGGGGLRTRSADAYTGFWGTY